MALLLFMTLAAWSMGSAVGSSPDEDYVLTSIWCGTEGNPPYCRKDPDRANAMILPIMAAEPQLCYMPGNGVESAACQKSILNQEISTKHYNRGLYPPYYLNFHRNFVSHGIESSVVKMRLTNSLLATVLVFVTFPLVRKKNSDVLIAWLAVITPVTSYIIASVNTSSWTLIGTSSFTFAILGALKNRKRMKIGVLFALVSLLIFWFTTLSRYEGKYLILLIFVFTTCSEIIPSSFRFTKKSVLIISATLLAIYLTFNSIANLFGRVNIFDDSRVVNTLTSNNLFIHNVLNLPRFLLGYFGSWGLGWFEVALTSTVWIFSLQTFLITTVFAFRKSNMLHRYVIGISLFFMCSAILYASQQQFEEIYDGLQPRYFLPFFLGIVIIAAANKTERYPNSLVITVAILATISNSIALRDTIRRYTTGQDVFISKSLNDPIEWWWQFGPQPETVWLTGTLAFAALWALLIYDRNKNEVEAPNSPAPELAN